jgi:hypothetical protein
MTTFPDGVESFETWMVIASVCGPDGMGLVVGYTTCETELEAESRARYRGQLCDVLGLYLDCDIPDDFIVECTTYGEFVDDYGNRFPLRNYKEW